MQPVFCQLAPVLGKQISDFWHKYLILRLDLWPGPLFTCDKEEKDHTSQRYIGVMHTKQVPDKKHFLCLL